MALPATGVWEIDPSTGNDLNGGGYDPAPGTGTDKSQLSPVIRTDLVLNSTTTMSSAGTAFNVSDINNYIQISAGTGFTVGFYKITTVVGGVATVDRAAGTNGSTGGTGRVGGPLATLTKLNSGWVGGNDAYVKDNGSTISMPVAMNLPNGTNTNPTRLIGYGTTRGDTGRPTLLPTGGNNYIFNNSNNHARFKNLIMDANIAGTATSGMNAAGANIVCEDCDVINFGNLSTPGATGFNGGTHATFIRCLVRTPRTSFIDSGFSSTSGGSLFLGCVSEGPGSASSNSYCGFNGTSTTPSTLIACIARKHGGSSGRGFYWSSTTSGFRMFWCIADDNKNDGIFISANASANYGVVFNCIMSRNQGYGMRYGGAAVLKDQQLDFNAYYSNTLGNRFQIPAGIGNVDLSATPFEDADNANFTTNNNNPGGAQLKNLGYPSMIARYALTATYFDIGLQHQDVGGGGGAAAIFRGMLSGGRL